MSDLTAPMSPEPSGASQPPRGGWPTSAKVLLGVLLALVLVGAGAGAAVLASSNNDDSKTVAAKHAKASTTTSSSSATTSTTSGATATTSSAGGGSGSSSGGGSATTPTTAQGGAGPGTKLAAPAPTNPAAISSADEPVFTSATAPSSIVCPNFSNGYIVQFIVSWATTNATSVNVSVSTGGSVGAQPPSGKHTFGIACDNTGSAAVQLSASGPGGNGVAFRTVTITHS